MYYYCLPITIKTHTCTQKHAEEYIPVHFNRKKKKPDWAYNMTETEDTKYNAT